jgi:ubiquinone/menaquinone biosynthesis C-methylase UbiE
MSVQEQSENLAGWQKSAAYWDKYRAVIAQVFAPLTKGLVEEARIGIGQRVLDIGGGSGEPSLTISSIVGPTGSVMYTDPVAGMVQSAQAEAVRRGLTNIEFRQCSADDLPFDDKSFDVAVARLSVMFFADPLTGVGKILRVIRNGGRLSFVVWGRREANPFFATTIDVVERLVTAPETESPGPDPFRFATPNELAGILKNAGAEDVVERELNFQIEAAIPFERFWQLRTEMSETLRDKLAGLTPDRIEAIKREVDKAARKYFVGDQMSFPAQALVVSGNKSKGKAEV